MATLSDCANHLGIDQAVLSRLIKESVLDKQDRGKYDVDAVRLQYLKHIRNQLLFFVLYGNSIPRLL